jgi:hypothetical protein
MFNINIHLLTNDTLLFKNRMQSINQSLKKKIANTLLQFFIKIHHFIDIVKMQMLWNY